MAAVAGDVRGCGRRYFLLGLEFRNHDGWAGGWKNNMVGRGNYNIILPLHA
jgi:hypothetical protein